MKSRKALEGEEERLRELLASLDALEFQIARQKRRIAALRELADESEDAAPSMSLVSGITDACRTVLRSAEKPLFPTEVKDRIERLGVPEQKNLLASVHTILKRLIEAEDVEKVGEKGDRYAWITLGERLRREERREQK